MLENADQKNPKYRHFSRSMTFSDIILEKRAVTDNTMVVSQAEMKKDDWVQGVEAYVGDLWIRSPIKIF